MGPISIRLRVFLTAFEASGNVSAAAKAAKLRRSSHYDALARNAAYREAFEQTVQRATTIAKGIAETDAAFTRAIIRALRLEADRLEKGLAKPK